MDILIPNFPQVFGGSPAWLQTCKEVAQWHGNNVHVIEPDGYTEREEFSKIYKHNSPNPAGFEMASFIQWFLVRKWMADNNRSVVFKIDCDVLVFEDLDSVASRLPQKYLCTVPAPTSFVTKEGADMICQTIMDGFRNGTAESVCDPNHVADNTLLSAVLGELGQPDLICGYRPIMVDPNITQPCGGLMNDGHRDIFFVAGKPYYFDGAETVRLLTLHCWGQAKLHMVEIWEQARKSMTQTAPVRLCYTSQQ